MKLLIPADHAIKILEARLGDIDAYNFNPKAWKDRTENDLREIFPLGSMQWLQVSQIHFDTFITSEKAKVLTQAKDTAKQLIASYIDFIQQHSKIAQQRQTIKEKDYEQKYNELLSEWNDLVPGYNELIKKYDDQLTSNEVLLETIDSKEIEIERIKAETLQFDNISMQKLMRAFFNLPAWQIVSIFSIIVGVIIGSFALGKTYQENASNSLLFDIKTENQTLKNQSILDSKSLIVRDSTIKELQEKMKTQEVKPKTNK